MKLVKICGLISTTDAHFVCKQKVDFLGMVMHKPSKRFCSIENAKMILQKINKPMYVVFGYDELDYIIETATLLKKQYQNLRVQLPYSIKNFNSITIKLLKYFSYDEILPAISVTKPFDDEGLKELVKFPLILLDSPAKKQSSKGPIIPGGSGDSFDWKMIENIQRDFLLAGGLNIDNIKDAVNNTNAIGFDVASGTESSHGKKDFDKVKQFVAQVKN